MKKLIVLTAVFAMLFAGSAMAADWNFYGSSRVALFSNSWNEDYAAANLTGWTSGAGYTTTTFAQQGNSRIGANVAAGDVSGRFEYGASGGNANIRLLYGAWNFGGGSMYVGQMYNPTYYGLSNQVFDGDNGLAGFGAPFSRLDAIEFRFGSFKIAAVQPNPTTAAPYTVNQGTIPKIEAAYNAPLGPVRLHVSGGFNTWDAVNPGTDDSKSVTSWVGQVMAKYNAGPLMLGGSFYYGSNLSNYGWNVGPAVDAGIGVDANGDITDTTSYAFTFVGAFTINDMMGLEGGIGYTTASADSNSVTQGDKDDTAMAYYLQLPLTLADGVFIVPEVGMYDFDKDSNDNKEGTITYFGAKFQINF
jgi:hypothetical protein